MTSRATASREGQSSADGSARGRAGRSPPRARGRRRRRPCARERPPAPRSASRVEPPRGVVERRARGQQLVGRAPGQPIDERLPRASPRTPRGRARRVQLARHAVDARRRTSHRGPVPSPARRSAAGGRAFEVRGQRRRLAGCWRPVSDSAASGPAAIRPTARRHSSNTSSTSASQKSIFTGRRRGPLPVVALEIAIDAAEGDLQRHALRGPARDEIERRPDHANQVAVVLLTQVGFDLAAVIY